MAVAHRRGWWLAAAALAGCNAILGNEDRIPLTDAGPDVAGGADGGDPDGAPSKEGGDGMTEASSGATPTVVVKAFKGEQVALADGALYFSYEGGVAWCLPSECESTKTQFFSASAGPFGLVVDGAGVVVVAPKEGFVYSFTLRPVGGGNLLASVTSPVGVAIDPTFAYFTLADGSLHRCPRSGCGGGPVLVARGGAPGGAVATGASRVIWAQTGPSGRLQQVDAGAVDGGFLSASADRSPRTLVANGPRLFWTGTGGAYQGELSVRDDGLDANEVICAQQLESPWGIAVDATHIYYSLDVAGEIRRVPLASCTSKPEIVATGQASPHGIAVDDSFIYWVNHAGSVMRRQK